METRVFRIWGKMWQIDTLIFHKIPLPREVLRGLQTGGLGAATEADRPLRTGAVFCDRELCEKFLSRGTSDCAHVDSSCFAMRKRRWREKKNKGSGSVTVLWCQYGGGWCFSSVVSSLVYGDRIGLEMML